MSIKPHEIASEVTAEEGEVHIDGPGGLAMSMTPGAAAKTADRLHAGANDALQQDKPIEGRPD